MAKVTKSKRNPYPSIYKKIRWGVGLPALILFAIFWGMIYWAENQMEVISLHHWIDTESSRYHRDYQNVGELAPAPNPNEFYSYWSEKDRPDWLKKYDQPGFYAHRFLKEEKHFLVTNHPSGTGLFYIVFKDEADDYLDDYEAILHLTTLILGGLVGIGMLLYSLYLIRSLSAPLSQIENKIHNVTPEHPDFTVDTQFKETREIEKVLLESKQAIAKSFQREQEFSGFASHELRSPIMVIKGSSELLKKIPDQPAIAIKAINRIERASDEMALLTDAFLILGKETIDVDSFSQIDLERLLRRQIDALTSVIPLAEQTNSERYLLTINEAETCHAPASLVTVVINNLLKNAFSYSSDTVAISLSNTTLSISNPCGELGDNKQGGYGVGLVIVGRICERMGWQYHQHQTQVNYETQIHFSSRPHQDM
ncbi:HAMP domain-containing histidine kinase [Vibrio lamellibrachiae]|uniref:sensor histidine kinase n=1 Tax=Vibrio lamellibrachiae TaxID=2910253 RepID=UPI003D13353D